MNECQRAKQIHLIDSLLYCLEKWRWIVGCMLIAGILLGTHTYLLTVKENKSIQKTQSAVEDTVVADSTDDVEKGDQLSTGIYEKAIQEMERDIEIQEDYLNRSIVMQLEPYHISTGILSYYVEGVDDMNSVIAAYSTIITSGRMAEALYAQDSDVPVEDLRYLISFVNINAAGNPGVVFQIQIKMPDGELSETYLKRAEELMEDYSLQLQTKVAEHQITLLESVQSEMADLDMQKYQSTIRTTYMTSVRNLQALRTESAAAKNTQEEKTAPVPPVVTVALKNPVELAEKSVVTGLILGACVSCVMLLLLYLFGNRLQAVENFQDEFKMPLIGIVRLSEAKKRIFGFIDSWIFSLRGGYYGKICLEEQIKIAVVNVQTMISKNNSKNIGRAHV